MITAEFKAAGLTATYGARIVANHVVNARYEFEALLQYTQDHFENPAHNKPTPASFKEAAPVTVHELRGMTDAMENEGAANFSKLRANDMDCAMSILSRVTS